MIDCIPKSLLEAVRYFSDLSVCNEVAARESLLDEDQPQDVDAQQSTDEVCAVPN